VLRVRVRVRFGVIGAEVGLGLELGGARVRARARG